MPGRTEWIDLDPYSGRVRVSDEYLVLEDHWIARTIEIESANDGEPSIYARVEVEASGPKLIELRFLSTDPDANGIRQSDLRSIQVSSLVEELVALWTFRIKRDENGEVIRAVPSLEERDFTDHVRFVGRLRMGKTSRDITPQLLERVAKIYRDNITRHPTKAVEHHFQVSQRMAAEYVSRARKRGLLPPTKRGKKQA